MMIGDIVINDRTNNKSKVVGILERNFYEKGDYTKGPNLLGNSIILFDLVDNKIIDCYDWEITRISNDG